MKIEKDTSIGKISIFLPVCLGDIMISNRTKYKITRIILTGTHPITGESGVYAINQASGLWVEIDNLELVSESNGQRVFKVVEGKEN